MKILRFKAANYENVEIFEILKIFSKIDQH